MNSHDELAYRLARPPAANVFTACGLVIVSRSDDCNITMCKENWLREVAGASKCLHFSTIVAFWKRLRG